MLIHHRNSLELVDNPVTHISVFEPINQNTGAEISYATDTSRKSFHLPKPPDPKSAHPMAIESFALDPHTYHEWMSEVERYLEQQKSL